MKKKRIWLSWHEQKKRKILLIMKLNLLFLFFLNFSLSATTFSQEKKVSLDLTHVSAMELFDEIQRQTGYSFVFNKDQAKAMGKLTIHASEEPVNKVLDKILGAINYCYTFENDIIIVTARPSALQKKEIKITGRVTDEQQLPLPGVTIRLKGINLGTATDKDGKYTFSFPEMEKPVLIFSFVGMESQTIDYVGQDTINIVMKEVSSQLEEVVVNTGYQKIDPKKLTSAVTTLKAEDILVSGLTSIDQMLEGHVPGMIFMQNSGQLGATPRLRIRGTSTILGNQEPLWVVDGIVQQDPVNVDPSQLNDLDFVNLLGNAISGLNPEDIEQIDVLKDASATAIYGARAANGVIVISTKKGKIGPPTISYALSGNFARRPHYSDRSVNMMNSRKRVGYSRELMAQGIVYPAFDTWIGYESVMNDFFKKRIDYDEMNRQVGKLESMNTDWFDLLMQNTFSHKHTLSISGGTGTIKYYASIGYNDMTGNIRGESYDQYSASMRLETNYKRFSVRFSMQGNVNEKKYTPEDIGAISYAYNTSRAIPAYNEDGSYWYYKKGISTGGGNPTFYDFNILNDMDHSWQHINSNQINFIASVDYKVIDPLKVMLTLSYGVSNTSQETYHGEETFLAKSYGTESADGEYVYWSQMPNGGELKEAEQRNNNWVGRLQIDFDKHVDKDAYHQIIASLGGELSSSHYVGRKQTYLGYLPERGKQMALFKIADYYSLEDLYSTAPEYFGVRTDKLTRLASAYLSASYNYRDLYIFNVNARIDASNAFGDRSNDKLNPIWSVSARWNAKDDVLKRAQWINSLSLRGSWGFQGNMLPTETPELIIRRGSRSPILKEYMSTVYKYANPTLKWEKTSSMNLTLDFSLFNNKLQGSASYYYKKTKDAFLSKTVSEINGIERYVVNKGTLENQGMELSLNFTPINQISSGNPDGFRWSFDPQLGQVLNKLIDRATKGKDKSLKDDDAITYTDYLDGSVNISGRPLNAFYSYRYTGLDPVDGRPTFTGTDAELKEKYIDMKKEDIFMSVMEYSGTRVPTIQGGIVNTFSYKRFVLSFNLTYSLGSKIRLLQLYSNIAFANGTIAPQPLENVRKEFLNRWKQPGDENRTDIPGVISNKEFGSSLYPWWANNKAYAFSNNIWQMYDNSNLRVVSGNYLKMQSLSFRYNFPKELCERVYLKSAYVGFSGTNLFTLCSKKLKGQDPTTQSGSASTINLSLRPTYSFNLNISF